MSFRMALPKGNVSRAFLYLLIFFLFLFIFDAVEKKMRDETDFDSIESYCGVLKKYYYRKAIRGESGMRAVVSNYMLGDDKRFKIGESYKKASNIISSDDIGKKICVYYLDKAVFYDPFIFQISIEGVNRLNLSDMKNIYLSPPSLIKLLVKVIFIFIFIFILLLQFRRN